MSEVLLDTDTISYFLRGDQDVLKRLEDYFSTFNYVHVSQISLYEILGGLYFRDAKNKLAHFKEFINRNALVPLDTDIIDTAANIYADLRKKGITISHADILIAATAIQNDLILITNNLKHFEHISLLKIDNWKKHIS